MFRQMLKAKIHRLTVTESRLDYEGSITIDKTLLETSGIVESEKVHVVNVSTGDRFETYVMTGKKNSGIVCLNGGAARMGSPGDLIIVISYAAVDEDSLLKYCSRKVLVDGKNRVKRIIQEKK
ncbi:MAG: aspartate 1-decarboxylase [Candidatus Saganbacteria bacterium]|nr:aspartate 1-decarboxylase [Candidatus Saganbacteria bacterium]